MFIPGLSLVVQGQGVLRLQAEPQTREGVPQGRHILIALPPQGGDLPAGDAVEEPRLAGELFKLPGRRVRLHQPRLEDRDHRLRLVLRDLRHLPGRRGPEGREGQVDILRHRPQGRHAQHRQKPPQDRC